MPMENGLPTEEELVELLALKEVKDPEQLMLVARTEFKRLETEANLNDLARCYGLPQYTCNGCGRVWWDKACVGTDECSSCC